MVIPLLRPQVSDCSTFCIVCDVPSIAFFCSESVECFPGMASKYVLKTFLYYSGVHLLPVYSYISCSTFVVFYT